MAIINIETATNVCSVAVSESGGIIFERASFDVLSHASLLGVFVEEAVNESVLHGVKIDAVAVSSGPGSYTGLRIGVSMAKGLCFGWNVPLISVPTLDILASSVIGDINEDALFCAMLDARRMEVYSAIYDRFTKRVCDTEAVIVSEDSYASLLKKQNVYFFGNGADKCKSVITSPNAIFIDGLSPLAREMVALSECAFAEKKFENVAYFEPFYFKDFVATVSKNKVLSEK